MAFLKFDMRHGDPNQGPLKVLSFKLMLLLVVLWRLWLRSGLAGRFTNIEGLVLSSRFMHPIF